MSLEDVSCLCCGLVHPKELWPHKNMQLKEHKLTEQNPNLFQGFKGFYNLTPNYLFKHFLA